MTPPNLFGLPVFPHFNFVFEFFCGLLLEVFLCSGHAITCAKSVVEDVLAPADVLVTLKLPQNGSAIISSTCEKGANGVPADTIYRLFVVAELGEFAHRLHLFLVEQCLHHCDIWFKLRRSLVTLCWILIRVNFL